MAKMGRSTTSPRPTRSPNVTRHESGVLIAASQIEQLVPGEVFVFGSNANGAHNGGAAGNAVSRFGAIVGQGSGLQGSSYAIVTRSGWQVLEREVQVFLGVAAEHPERTFLLTKIGTGKADFAVEAVAPLFRNAPRNVALPDTFVRALMASIRAEWERDLLALSAYLFAALDSVLSSRAVLSGGWHVAHPLWSVDPAEAEQLIEQAIASRRPHATEPPLRYVEDGVLLLRSLFEQGRYRELVETIESQVDSLMDVYAWVAQMYWLSLAELALENDGAPLEAATRRWTCRVPAMSDGGWDPDLLLRALTALAATDLSWLGGDDLRPTIAQVALGVAEKAKAWILPWYDDAMQARLVDISGLGYWLDPA